MIDSGWGVGLAIKRSWVQFPVGSLTSDLGQHVVVVVVVVVVSLEKSLGYTHTY